MSFEEIDLKLDTVSTDVHDRRKGIIKHMIEYFTVSKCSPRYNQTTLSVRYSL